MCLPLKLRALEDSEAQCCAFPAVTFFISLPYQTTFSAVVLEKDVDARPVSSPRTLNIQSCRLWFLRMMGCLIHVNIAEVTVPTDTMLFVARVSAGLRLN